MNIRKKGGYTLITVFNVIAPDLALDGHYLVIYKAKKAEAFQLYALYGSLTHVREIREKLPFKKVTEEQGEFFERVLKDRESYAYVIDFDLSSDRDILNLYPEDEAILDEYITSKT